MWGGGEGGDDEGLGELKLTTKQASKQAKQDDDGGRNGFPRDKIGREKKRRKKRHSLGSWIEQSGEDWESGGVPRCAIRQEAVPSRRGVPGSKYVARQTSYSCVTDPFSLESAHM